MLALPPAPAILGTAIALEIAGTTCMKLAALGSRWWYAGVTVLYGLCFAIFPIALRTLPLGLSYAIWAGMGTTGTAIIGALYFKERMTVRKLFWIAMIIAGVAGLNFDSS